MTVRRHLFVLLAFAALLFGAGCGGGDRVAAIDETEEAAFKDGVQLKNQGRYNEALAAFLRVIEKRGEQASAESHLEAGLIYLERIKDPVEAIHQFRKYLELKPNAREAALVRGRVDVAKRQFALMLRGPNPLESVQSDQQDELDSLRRDNEALRAELQAVHNGVAAPGFHTLRPVPEADAAGGRDAPTVALPLALAPPPAPAAPHRPVPVISFSPQASSPPAAAPAPTLAPAVRASPPAAAASGRTHKVAAGDTLYRISLKYFGNGSKVDAIFNANRDIMPNKNTPLRLGMELKIP